MGQLTRAQLKALWVLLYKPIQSDYADLFDSFFNLLEDDNVITNAKLAEVAQNIIKGRVSAGAGNVEDLTVAQVRTLLQVAYQAMTDAFQFGGQAHGGFKLVTYSATPTFNLNNGNNQYMPVTASTTCTLSNKLAGWFSVILEVDTASSPTISLDSTFGTAAVNSEEISNADNDINVITVLVLPSGTTVYSNTVITS